MEEERYFLLNKEYDFPQSSLEGLVFAGERLTLEDAANTGIFLSGVMDSAEDGCRWRRILTDCEPAEALEITLYAADGERDSERLRAEIGSDAPMDVKLARLEQFKKAVISGGRDFPIRDIASRFLAAGVRLTKTGPDVPSLSFVQLWCSEESMLKYLPEIYHGADTFLDRYLRIFSDQYLKLERSIELLRERFDPQTASEEDLRMLAEALNIEHVHLWDNSRLRRLLCEGVYRKKGTFLGLKQLIAIYTDSDPLIAERFRMVTGIEENDMLYADSDLTILLTGAGCELCTMRSLHLIIQWFLPAGVNYSLVASPESAVLSRHSYLGVNSRISPYSQAMLDGRSSLQYAVLAE